MSIVKFQKLGIQGSGLVSCTLVITVVLLLVSSCISTIENPEKESFERDSFLDIESIRDRMLQNVYLNDSIDYMFYGLNSGEITLAYNYDLPFTLRVLSFEYDPDVYPPALGKKNRPFNNGLVRQSSEIGSVELESESDADDGTASENDGLIQQEDGVSDITYAGDGLAQKWGYIRRHHNIEINMNRKFNNFDDYETEIWLAALLSSMSYVIVHRADIDDVTGIDFETVGEIFLKSLDPYLTYQSERVESILEHPMIAEYVRIKEMSTAQERDSFYANIFDVTANTLYLSYLRVDEDVEDARLERDVSEIEN